MKKIEYDFSALQLYRYMTLGWNIFGTNFLMKWPKKTKKHVFVFRHTFKLCLPSPKIDRFDKNGQFLLF